MPFPRVASLARRVLPLHRLRERVPYEIACREAAGQFVELPLGRCHYREAGAGAPVLLVHGYLYSTVMWEPVFEPLSRHFRTLAVDLLGWGYSARNPALTYDYQLYADQLRQLLDALDVERVALVGQSMGGGTAIRFAVQHPDRVSCLVLVDAASLPNPTALAGRLFALPLLGELLMLAGGNRLIGKMLKDLWFHDPSWVTPEYTEKVVRTQRIEDSSATSLGILRQLDFGSQEALVEQLGALDVPTLLVWGAQDVAVPLAVGRRMHALLPGSELCVLDEAGHTPHEERPEAFLEHVVPFLGRHAGSAAR